MKRTYLLLLLAWSAAAADSLTGTWTADARSKGGIGTTLKFSGDGAVTSMLGAIVDFRFAIDGQILTTTFQEPSGTNTVMHQAFQLTGNKLVTEPADPDKRLEMTRVGTGTSLAGQWTYELRPGTQALLQYNTNNTGQLFVPMQTRQGQYKLESGMLTFEFPGEPATARQVTLSGDHLTLLAEADHREQRFTRVSP